MQLDGKVVVVTGGAGAFGRAFVHAIAANGGTAMVADIDERAATQVARETNAVFPGRADALTLDVTSKTSIVEAIQIVQLRRGRVDAVVNNA